MITCAKECRLFRVNECAEITDGEKSLPQFPDVIYAGHNSERQGRIVAAMRGEIEVTNLQQLAKEIAMDSNLHTVIYDLTTRAVWVANRHGSARAADCEYVEFPFDAWWRE